MPAAKLNMLIEQGATFRKRLVWRDKNKRPINLTGFSAAMHLVDKAGPGAATLLVLSTDNGRITLGAKTGEIILLLTAADTAALTFSAASYDLKLVSGSEEARLLEGRITVSPAITPRGA